MIWTILKHQCYMIYTIWHILYDLYYWNHFIWTIPYGPYHIICTLTVEYLENSSNLSSPVYSNLDTSGGRLTDSHSPTHHRGKGANHNIWLIWYCPYLYILHTISVYHKSNGPYNWRWRNTITTKSLHWLKKLFRNMISHTRWFQALKD